MSRIEVTPRRALGRRLLTVIIGLTLMSNSAGSLTEVSAVLSGITVGPPSTQARQAGDDVGARRDEAAEAYGRIPLQFEANEGQAGEKVDFIVRAGGYSALLSPDGAAFAIKLRGKGTGVKNSLDAVSMDLLGSNAAAEPEGFGRLPGRVNYFGGAKALTGIQTYTGVLYRGVYAGVDLKYYGNQSELEHDFLVRPGGRPDVIEFELKGGKRARIDSSGALSVSLSDGGDLRMSTSASTSRRPSSFR